MPYLETNSQRISSSNQYTKSNFFRLEPFGLQLEPPQCFSEKQIDYLFSNSYVILPWTYPLPTWTYFVSPVTIPYTFIFGQTLALMKPVDSEHKRRHGPEKGREPRLEKIMKLNYKRIHEILRL